ncbi:MAG: epimerase [Thermoplasmata archaeon]
MRVVIFGASGMVGQGVLRERLLDPGTAAVLTIGRCPLGRTDPKLRGLVVPDVGHHSAAEEELRGCDAAFWCLGAASAGMTEPEYRRVTYDLTLGAASTLARLNPAMSFVYVSGAGTDSTERGRSMWARVKGATEIALLRLPFRAVYLFRPGIIRPLHGIHSKTRSYRVGYLLLAPFLGLVRLVAPNSMTTTERVGRAMLHVAREGGPSRIVRTHDINALGT